MVLYGLLDEHEILWATFEVVIIYIYKLIFLSTCFLTSQDFTRNFCCIAS